MNTEDGSDATCLGPLPHQIRGFLSSFHTMMPTTEAFPQCTACSDTVSLLLRVLDPRELPDSQTENLNEDKMIYYGSY